ncbi:hypothetical protein ACFL47_05825 [Candidatus Latescibacterota bacterium]
MRKSAIFLFVILLPFLVIAESIEKPQPFLLRKGAAGKLKLGMSKNELYKQFDEKLTELTDLKLEGHYCPAIAIYLSDESNEEKQQPNLIAEITQKKDWTVWRIRVYDKRFRTKEGIGIGSTFGEIKKLYDFGWSHHGEHMLCAEVKDLKVHFEINGWFSKKTRDSIPDDREIISVVVN